MNTIKCGRTVYDLKDGDTVMDNGHCLQLITRTITKGWNTTIPIVSKAEFKRFKKNSRVTINTNHSYGDTVVLWTYFEATVDE